MFKCLDNARVMRTMHRKRTNMARMTGLYPLAVVSDCAVYPSLGDSPLDFLPYAASGKPQPGGFRLGPTPGLAKLEGVTELEGVQRMLWAVELMEQGLTPARHIKDGDVVLEVGEWTCGRLAVTGRGSTPRVGRGTPPRAVRPSATPEHPRVFGEIPADGVAEQLGDGTEGEAPPPQ